uniref:Uncharacterized protein n=1 Tax=Aegilops tauschii TaxID=37682 RepID=M8BZD0_AEGTA
MAHRRLILTAVVVVQWSGNLNVQRHVPLRPQHQDHCREGWRLGVRQGGGQCDSIHGCDAEHNYEEPCASPAVWDALGLDQSIGLQDVTWSDE